MRLLVLIAALAVVGGCINESVLLRHPETGKTVQCGPYPIYGDIASVNARLECERACIQEYQRQGYEVME